MDIILLLRYIRFGCINHYYTSTLYTVISSGIYLITKLYQTRPFVIFQELDISLIVVHLVFNCITFWTIEIFLYKQTIA